MKSQDKKYFRKKKNKQTNKKQCIRKKHKIVDQNGDSMDSKFSQQKNKVSEVTGGKSKSEHLWACLMSLTNDHV